MLSCYTSPNVPCAKKALLTLKERSSTLGSWNLTPSFLQISVVMDQSHQNHLSKKSELNLHDTTAELIDFILFHEYIPHVEAIAGLNSHGKHNNCIIPFWRPKLLASLISLVYLVALSKTGSKLLNQVVIAK
jgi:hypothetical protein